MFFNPEKLHEPGMIDDLIRGMSTTSMETLDQFITDEVTNHLFEDKATPYSGLGEWGMSDSDFTEKIIMYTIFFYFAALNIQREFMCCLKSDFTKFLLFFKIIVKKIRPINRIE